MTHFIDSVSVSSRLGANGLRPFAGEGFSKTVAREIPLQSHEVASRPEAAIEAAVLSSRRFLDSQRQRLLLAEGDATDYAVVASETVIVPAAGREGDNKDGYTLYGASSFGRKNGQGTTTVLTYVDIAGVLPGNSTADAAAQTVTAGVVEVALDEENRKTFTKKPRLSLDVRDETQRRIAGEYATGLTGEVMGLADSVSRFEHEAEPVIRDAVAGHPFNTLGFYSFPENERGEFYRHAADPESGYFAEEGGNCVLFTLHAGRHFREKDIPFRVAHIPSSPALPSGHTALIAGNREGTLSFFVDPGLSLTQPILLNSPVPLYPFAFEGNKQIFVSHDGNGTPRIRIHTKKAKSNLFLGETLSYGDFLARAPSILEEMDRKRTHAKLDYHLPDGTAAFSCAVNLERGTVSFRAGDTAAKDVPINQFLDAWVCNPALLSHLSRYNISPAYISGKLAALRNTAS